MSMRNIEDIVKNKIATIKIIDEINCYLIGLRQSDYKYFYDKFGYFDNGYFFKPTYKLGRWDGKIRLFSKSGKTSIHFLPEILKDLKSLGYKIKLIDKRNPIKISIPTIDNNYFKDKCGIILQDHQVECINNLLENFGGIAVAATGAGKSYIIGALFSLLNEYAGMKCIAIVPSIDLVNQTAEEIKKFGNDVGCYNGKLKETDKTHLVSTWQSLNNSKEILYNYQAIIVDEAHGVKSNVLQNMICEYGKNAIFIAGVTGTLPKEEADFMRVKYVLGEQVAKVGGKYLIDKGWLAKLNLTTVTLKEDLSDLWKKYLERKEKVVNYKSYKDFKNNVFVDYDTEKRWIKKNQKRTQFIANFIESMTKKNGNSFVLVNGVDFGKKLSKMIPNSVFLYGEDDTTFRKKVYDLFSNNDDTIVIATYQLASTGLNIKRIFNLFLVDPGKSFIQIIQSIGRGLRKAEDKDSVHVWDISSDLKYSKKHALQRKKYYTSEKYEFKTMNIDYSEV